MTELEKYIRKQRQSKDILLISHAVLGYPSLEQNEEIVDALVDGGAELIELQIPFSDPQADGPYFTRANQQAVTKGIAVSSCMDFADKICCKYPQTSFLLMTYYNIVLNFGLHAFVQRAKRAGIRGVILPDLPLEEAGEFINEAGRSGLAFVLMAAPTTGEKRLKEINKAAQGFLYCQARAGVTGTQTHFTRDTDRYIERCRISAKVPLAMGFGITRKEDVDFLKGKVDIAICCTRAVQMYDEKGKDALKAFIASLR